MESILRPMILSPRNLEAGCSIDLWMDKPTLEAWLRDCALRDYRKIEHEMPRAQLRRIACLAQLGPGGEINLEILVSFKSAESGHMAGAPLHPIDSNVPVYFFDKITGAELFGELLPIPHMKFPH